MGVITPGYVFADGSGALTAARLNSAFSAAGITTELITGKSAITPDVADSLVFYDASGSVLGKCTITTFITAIQGITSGKVAAGNDSRFSASVTGIRLSAGAGGTDTAAVAKNFAFAPTTSTPTAGAVTLNCALNNLFTSTFVVNTTVTLTNISDGDTICHQITQDGTGSRLLTLVTTQTLWYEGNSAYVLSTAANSVDLLFFRRIGNQILTWIKKDFGP
jgi:hypothetical protein